MYSRRSNRMRMLTDMSGRKEYVPEAVQQLTDASDSLKADILVQGGKLDSLTTTKQQIDKNLSEIKKTNVLPRAEDIKKIIKPRNNIKLML